MASWDRDTGELDLPDPHAGDALAWEDTVAERLARETPGQLHDWTDCPVCGTGTENHATDCPWR